MDLTFNDRELAFRDELRAWFAENPPGEEPEHDEDAHYAWSRVQDAYRNSPTYAGLAASLAA